jgi:hypothetical protein
LGGIRKDKVKVWDGSEGVGPCWEYEGRGSREDTEVSVCLYNLASTALFHQIIPKAEVLATA